MDFLKPLRDTFTKAEGPPNRLSQTGNNQDLKSIMSSQQEIKIKVDVKKMPRSPAIVEGYQAISGLELDIDVPWEIKKFDKNSIFQE